MGTRAVHHDTTEDAHEVVVLCGTKGGYGYVVSDASATVAQAVESAKRYGGTPGTRGYTAYEFGPGCSYAGHDPLYGIRWNLDDPDVRVGPTVTERNRLGRVTETVMTPEGLVTS